MNLVINKSALLILSSDINQENRTWRAKFVRISWCDVFQMLYRALGVCVGNCERGGGRLSGGK